MAVDGDDPALSPTTPGTPPSKDAPWVGRTVAHYRVESVLGRGGMGVVYRARDEKLGRAVALKSIAPGIAADAQARARFFREARAASALDHPHIGTVYGIEEADGAAFIVLALYEGETLRDRLARGALAPAEARRVVRQLLDALGAAHAAGIVHRDVKPANVFLAQGGNVKVLDFGLARLENAGDAVTVEAARIGTLLYMSPEQLKGLPADLRADLWAVGVVLHEMLTGRAPFRAEDNAVIAHRIANEPPPVLPPGTPADLARLHDRLLQKDRGARPASADEARAILDAAGRNPWPRRAGVALGVLALAGGAAAVLRHHGGKPAPAARVESAAAPDLLPPDENQAKAIFEHGVREFEVGHYHDAAEDYVKVYLRTGDSVLLYNIAQAYRLAGERDKALETFRSLRQKMADNAEVDAEMTRYIDQLEAEMEKGAASQK